MFIKFQIKKGPPKTNQNGGQVKNGGLYDVTCDLFILVLFVLHGL